MKAVLFDRYGPPDALQLKEVEKPVPKADEILVKIEAAFLNAYDWHMLTADIFLVRLMGGGLFKPAHGGLGADIAGRVGAVGSSVTQFIPGDEVFGDIAGSGSGGLAGYAAVPERVMAQKPENLSFEEAADVPMAGVTALPGLRDDGEIQAGQKVLIQGASGGVGTFALQLAKASGAEVTAVCSTRNLDQARALGADHEIDYTVEKSSSPWGSVANENPPCTNFTAFRHKPGSDGGVPQGSRSSGYSASLPQECKSWWI